MIVTGVIVILLGVMWGGVGLGLGLATMTSGRGAVAWKAAVPISLSALAAAMKVLWFATSLVLLALFGAAGSGCATSSGGNSSPSESQATVLAISYGTCTLAANLQPDPYEKQIDLLRCERTKDEGLAQIRRMQAAERAQREEAARMEQQRREMFRQIRINPRWPELGATYPEARRICEEQHGVLVFPSGISAPLKNSLRDCRLPEQSKIFGFAINETGRLVMVEVTYLGADSVAIRQRAEKDHGPPHHETVNGHGFREWQWDLSWGTYWVGGHPSGAYVRATLAKVASVED